MYRMEVDRLNLLNRMENNKVQSELSIAYSLRILFKRNAFKLEKMVNTVVEDGKNKKKTHTSRTKAVL